jgi:hypothetical protein
VELSGDVLAVLRALPGEVELFDEAGAELLEGWLSRRAYPSLPLAGSPHSGPVVRNERLVVRATFRRQGLATGVYLSEDTMYRKWGVREVHLTATEDGPIVWLRQGFRFRDEAAVLRSYAAWANRQRPPKPAVSNPAELPEAFLRHLGYGTVELVKVLT